MKRLVALSLVLLAVSPSLAAPVACQKGRKISLRDGACKGKETPVALDASTLNGLSASEIQAQAAGEATAGLGTFLDSSYVVSNTGPIEPGFCVCASIECHAGDFLLNCNGSVPADGSAYLVALDDATVTQAGRCSACGCTLGAAASNVAVSATCLER